MKKLFSISVFIFFVVWRFEKNERKYFFVEQIRVAVATECFRNLYFIFIKEGSMLRITNFSQIKLKSLLEQQEEEARFEPTTFCIAGVQGPIL